METVHLKTCSNFFETNSIDKSKLIIEKFIESCLKLDASIFEPFMDEDDIFEEKDKYKFLADLRDLFNLAILKTQQERTVNFSTAKCLGCNFGKFVTRFDVYQGNELKFGFGFVVCITEEILKDIFRCNLYKG